MTEISSAVTLPKPNEGRVEASAALQLANLDLDIEQASLAVFPFANDRLAPLHRMDILVPGDGRLGSVDLTRVAGTTHPDYGGMPWGRLKPQSDNDLCGLKRAMSAMRLLRGNPHYYLSRAPKPAWSFYEIYGQFFIIEGNHRTVVARFLLSLNQLPPIVHGVLITPAVIKAVLL